MADTQTRTTTAATLDTVTQPFGAGVAADEFELINLSVGATAGDVLWFTTDPGVTLTVGGAGAYPCRPGERIQNLRLSDATGSTAAVFRAISTNAVQYTLMRQNRVRKLGGNG